MDAPSAPYSDSTTVVPQSHEGYVMLPIGKGCRLNSCTHWDLHRVPVIIEQLNSVGVTVMVTFCVKEFTIF